MIINLSSGAGNTPVPLVALYSASKAYNNFLSLAMEMEYREHGIIIQVILRNDIIYQFHRFIIVLDSRLFTYFVGLDFNHLYISCSQFSHS